MVKIPQLMISIVQEIITTIFLDHSLEGKSFLTNYVVLLIYSTSLTLLSFVIFNNSVKKARDSISCSYGQHINGFAAILEEEHAQQLAS